ncbi:MAG: hypothetical protein LUH40_06425 [Clostridiales bacterium]|nr:hypothetical protein [Clostridiales bacterium]
MDEKFITVFDDTTNEIFDAEQCRKLGITKLNSCYQFENLWYYDAFNTDSTQFSAACRQSDTPIVPTLPCSLFRFAYSLICENGVFSAFILCPHGKFTPYYKNAKKAVDMFMRRKGMRKSGFNLYVINTKSFSLGVEYAFLNIISDIYTFHFTAKETAERAKKRHSKALTYILSMDDFGMFHGKKILGTRVIELDITQSVEAVQLEKFAEIVSVGIIRCGLRENKCDFALSYGAECDFHKRILGRIKKNLMCDPYAVTQYSIPTASVFGNNAVCIHVLPKPDIEL